MNLYISAIIVFISVAIIVLSFFFWLTENRFEEAGGCLMDCSIGYALTGMAFGWMLNNLFRLFIEKQGGV